MRKYLILAALLCAGAIAFAQTTPLYNLTGNETVVTTLGSGSSIAIPINQIRNTNGVSPIGTGTTVNASPTGATGYLVATGPITTLNMTLPNPAYSGQTQFVSSDNGVVTTLNTTVVTGTQTQTLNTAFSGSVSPASPAGWVYYTLGTTPTTGTWYRIR